jgi:carbon monoxide dehydrogenase subunit G
MVAGSCYVMEYRARFHFAVPPFVLWSRIEQFDQFERWWGWLGSFRAEGDGLREGSVLRGVVAPPLPYRMAVQVELTRCEPCRRLDADVTGDLAGDAHLRLRPDGEGDAKGDGGGTVTEVEWSLEMLQRPMRWVARVGYPLLRWGHDRVVEATVRSFASELEVLQAPPGP